MSPPLPVGELVELPLDQFLALYDPQYHDQIKEMLSRDGVSAMVDFYNPDMWSSQRGHRSAVTVGPGCMFKTVEECRGKWLGQSASDRKYAKHYTRRT